MNTYDLILLDRDGVINFDETGYIAHPDDWTPIPGSLEAIARLNQAGKKVAVISNQSGLGRGYFQESDLNAVHDKMTSSLKQVDGHLDAIFYCPHHPNEHCACRKPKTVLLTQAQQQFNVPTERILVIGDSECDLFAANNFDCDACLVLTGRGKATLAALSQPEHYLVAQDLQTAVTQLLGHTS